MFILEYEIDVTTANYEGAGTKENVYIVLEGKRARSKEFMMENSSKKKRFVWYELAKLAYPIIPWGSMEFIVYFKGYLATKALITNNLEK